MKKISINKNDDVAAVVDKMLYEPDPEIVLVVPKHSKLKETPRNFNLLKREAEAAGRKVSVESVDDEVLTLAEASGLFNEHPFFNGPARSISDIVPGAHGGESGNRSRIIPKQNGPKVTLNVRREIGEEEKTQEAEDKFFTTKSRNNTTEEAWEDKEEQEEEVPSEDDWELQERKERKIKSRIKWLVVFATVIVLVGGGAWITGAYFSKANTTISFKQTEWQYASVITASKNIPKVDLISKSIPAEVFHDKRNLTQLFPATGRSVVSQKASGKIKIVNAYSSEKQTLVATTRFSTPDGKIFRLDSQVLVPGAQIKDGKIIPASTEALVTADRAGAEYNIGPTPKLTIPGFKGTPKYDGFYGQIETTFSGGFVGEKAVPTEADIKSAEERMTEILKTGLESNILSEQIKDYKVLEGSSSFKVNKMTVKKETNDSGAFSVFGEAEVELIGFKESTLDELLKGLAGADLLASGTEYESSFRSLEKNYSEIRPNYEKGELKFNLSAKGTLAAAFDKDVFKSELTGKTIEEAEDFIQGLPGLASGRVGVWPVWLSNLPGNSDRINILSD